MINTDDDIFKFLISITMLEFSSKWKKRLELFATSSISRFCFGIESRLLNEILNNVSREKNAASQVTTHISWVFDVNIFHASRERTRLHKTFDLHSHRRLFLLGNTSVWACTVTEFSETDAFMEMLELAKQKLTKMNKAIEKRLTNHERTDILKQGRAKTSKP